MTLTMKYTGMWVLEAEEGLHAVYISRMKRNEEPVERCGVDDDVVLRLEVLKGLIQCE